MFNYINYFWHKRIRGLYTNKYIFFFNDTSTYLDNRSFILITRVIGISITLVYIWNLVFNILVFYMDKQNTQF